MRIKICGITRLADAKLAVSLGADYLGFVFAKSSRRVSVKKAAQIISRLPRTVKTVGVFVNEKSTQINQIIKRLGLKFAQLHGEESPAFCQKINGKVIKALRVKSRRDLLNVKKYKTCYAVLLDAYVKNKRGGTGKTFNWRWVKEAQKYHKRIFLAGGINPRNVGAAVKLAKPFALDCSSGVEARKGKKSAARLRKFFDSAKIK